MCFSSQSIECMVARLDVRPEIIPALVELLDDAERDRANRFVFKRDRFRYIVGRARLRQGLSARLGLRPEAVELVYGKRGKPMLASQFASLDLRFNLSHSEDIAIYAFSVGREIGIDVEAVRMVPDADAIAARFFSPREYEAYLNLNLRDRAQGFFNCWTRKEAFIKALGDGLYYPLDRFDVSLAPGEPAKILRVEKTPGDHCGWRVENLSPAPGFVAAVVVEDPSSRDRSSNIFPVIGLNQDRPYVYQ